MEFLPAQDTGEYTVNVTLPNGVALRETMRAAQQVEKILMTIPENERLNYTVGGSGMDFFGSGQSNTASFSGKLVSMNNRYRSIDEELDEIREKPQGLTGMV